VAPLLYAPTKHQTHRRPSLPRPVNLVSNSFAHGYHGHPRPHPHCQMPTNLHQWLNFAAYLLQRPTHHPPPIPTPNITHHVPYHLYSSSIDHPSQDNCRPSSSSTTTAFILNSPGVTSLPVCPSHPIPH
jgi:hypothetical protein